MILHIYLKNETFLMREKKTSMCKFLKQVLSGGKNSSVISVLSPCKSVRDVNADFFCYEDLIKPDTNSNAIDIKKITGYYEQ